MWFIQDLRKKCPNTRIHIGTHSLGARVALRGLKKLAGSVKGIDRVVLTAPAVDNEVFEKGEEFEDVPSYVTRIDVAYNKGDWVLQNYYRGAATNVALGENGVETAGEVVHWEQVRQRDFSKEWGWGDAAHSSIYDGKKAKTFWRHYTPNLN